MNGDRIGLDALDYDHWIHRYRHSRAAVRAKKRWKVQLRRKLRKMLKLDNQDT